MIRELGFVSNVSIKADSLSTKKYYCNLRTDYENDTREEVLNVLAKHFGFA